MKKLAILSMTAMFALAFVQLSAQDVKKEIKSEIKTEQKDVKAEKKAIKTEREELRKLEGADVSEKTKNAFYADFGNVQNVKWKRAVYLDEAVFTKGGKEMKAYYDFYSKLVGTTMLKTFADLPMKAQKEIKAKYKDYTVKNVVFYDDSEANATDMIIYDTQFSDEDNYFVELSKDQKNIVVQVKASGELQFFKEI